MKFFSKFSPSVVALILTIIISIISIIALYIIHEQNLENRVKNIDHTITKILYGQSPDRQTLEKIATENELGYIAAYQNGSAQPIQDKIVQSEDLSIIQKLFPSTIRNNLPIDNTQYFIEYRLLTDSFINVFFIQIFILFFAILLSCLFTASIIQDRFLNRLKQLKIAVSQKKFDNCDEKEISSSVESAYKEYETKILELANENNRLKILVDQDSLTGICNRKKFRNDLTKLLEDKEQISVSVLAIIRATELTNINQTRGFARGDQYLQDISKLITTKIESLTSSISSDSKNKPEVYRLSGSDFAIIVPNSNVNMANMLAKELKLIFDQYMNDHELESTAYTGLTLVKAGQTAEQVLARADRALSEAQTNTVNSGFFKDDSDTDFVQGESHWKGIIQEIIDTRAIVLQQQTIQSLNFSIKCYTEIFSKFVNSEGVQYPTETVFAMAQRHDLLLKLEEMIIEFILNKYNTNNLSSQRWGINLSINALLNTSFVIWLERLLLKKADIAPNLVFEISENILDCNLAASIRLFDMLRRVNVKSCISKFGNGLGSFRLYRELKPDYIKLDPSLVDTLERDHSSQLFVRMIVEVSHRLGCIVIAEGVEEYSQKQMLESMYIDAVQGYLISKPQPLFEGKGTDFVNSNNNQGVGNDNSEIIIG